MRFSGIQGLSKRCRDSRNIFFSCFLNKLTIHRNLFVPLAVSCNTTTAVTRGAALAADGCRRLRHRNWYRCWCAWREGDSCRHRSRCWRRWRSSRNWTGLFCGIVCPLFLKRCRETWFNNKTWTRSSTNSGFWRKSWGALHQLISFTEQKHPTCQKQFQNLPKLDLVSLSGIELRTITSYEMHLFLSNRLFL